MSQLATRLLDILKDKAFQKKSVTLASGRQSNFYIDVKRVSLSAEGAVLIGQGIFDKIRNHFPSAKAVGGLTLGADPIVTAVAYASFLAQSPLDAFIVRKEPKGHGLNQYIEGGHALQSDSEVVIVEDVVTSGASGLEAAKRASERGWKVLGIISVVDRQEGGRQAIESCGYSFYSLHTKGDFGILDE
jgi:orotate phosphoribosyltransferase